jgi:hypothetical protein
LHASPLIVDQRNLHFIIIVVKKIIGLPYFRMRLVAHAQLSQADARRGESHPSQLAEEAIHFSSRLPWLEFGNTAETRVECG